MLKKISFALALSVFAVPFLASAQNFTQVNNILGGIGFILGLILPLIITLGVAYFLWGIITYVLGKSDDAKKEGKNRIIYGFIAIAVMTMFWGVIKFFSTTTGIRQQGGGTALPCVINPGGVDVNGNPC